MDTHRHHLSRRAFLHNGALVLTTAASGPLLGAETPRELTVGLMTDLHYADKEPKGTRHYRDTLDKLAEATQQLRAAQPDFVVELGDFIDAAESVKTELGYLRRINREFAPAFADRHYVLGNHCVDTLTKQEFLDGVGQKKSYYSFNRGGRHFVLLDSCFRSDHQPYQRKNFTWTDPNIPPAELDWLKDDLKRNTKPTVVFAHQRLDASKNHSVKNAAAVREILEKSGHVQAVFQGHSHKNEHQQINGIHYVTLRAMVEGAGAENNGYALARFKGDGVIRIEGFRRQENYESL
ncbi:MAG: metallophosphoesterase family protein [Planctomycetota bacterium]|jgi:alkaline phosphatase